jgi:hypothetical protein
VRRKSADQALGREQQATVKPEWDAYDSSWQAVNSQSQHQIANLKEAEQ